MYHLTELRYRLAYLLIGYVTAVITAYFFSEELLYIIAKPLLYDGNSLEERRLIYTNITEAFTTQIILALYVGLYIIIPNIIYQAWSFLKPGLYFNEQKFLKKTLGPSIILFALGLFLTFSVLIPAICKFFVGFETNLEDGAIQIQLEAKISEYVFIVTYTIFLISILSQYPLIILSLIYLEVIDFEWLVKQRKFFILGFFILGAMCTPPDILSQIFLALLLITFYEGTLISLLAYKNYSNSLQQCYNG
jgi:sec-independent protein translocase protein TatC